ncbi:MAG TPA: hypothetical protein VJN18_11195 [Polyangiaceae bacterium]|nr:hypothetical protein [Polyangiaceae bacterium]
MTDVWVRVHEQRAVVGPPMRGRRGRPAGPHPPAWLVLGPRPSNGAAAPTLAYGTFSVDAAGELERVRITHGPVSPEMVAALLEAGRAQWARRRR